MPRADPPDIFDEQFYLRQNLDVARAVAEGGFASGLEHYLARGREEGRQPAPMVDRHPGGEGPIRELSRHHRDSYYLAPHDLAITPNNLQRILIVGSCFAQAWQLHVRNSLFCEGDFILTNNIPRLSDDPPRSADAYDFQIVQIAARSVINDDLLWKLRDADVKAHEVAFATARQRLELQLSHLLHWNRATGLLTFVVNFLVPQHNPLGRLLPRYDLSNPSYFVERLNAELGAMLKAFHNVYLIDADAISASIGRRHIQDDGVDALTHNSLLPNGWDDRSRIEPTPRMDEHYEVRPHSIFVGALWEEILAAYRTIRQVDMVKLVVVDLDDTLWRGVSGEQEAVGPEMVEGWPLGLIEALAFLKRRGVLLAIISKNDDERVRRIWDTILRKRLALSDFAAVKINWRPKSENMQEILTDLNLLPRNTVFVDDNPVERSGMKAAFPDMRILGRYPYYLRRILLWSPETQVAAVSDESSRRTEMVKAQMQRDTARKELSRDEFLSSLNLRCTIFTITSTEDARFPRSLELINKTNQFNTTGRRLTAGECKQAFADGAVFHAFEVEDRFVGYGLVGVVITRGRTIEQFVMSCRVVGLDVEIAVLCSLIERMLSWSPDPVRATFVTTDANLLCRDVFSRCGFVKCDTGWLWTGDTAPQGPLYVEMSPKVIEHLASATNAAAVSRNEELVIEFRRDGNARSFLGEGWSGQEDGHIWSVGRESSLRPLGLQPGTDYRLRLDAAAFVPPGGGDRSRLRVFAAGTLIAEFRLSQKFETVFCDLPRNVVGADGQIRLSFEQPDFGRPAEHGHPDTRNLAFCFREIGLASAGDGGGPGGGRPGPGADEASQPAPARTAASQPATAGPMPRDRRIACLVLAHIAPAILGASAPVLHSAGLDILVHLDAKDNIDKYRLEMRSAAETVKFLDKRVRIFWGGYSMLEAEFILMESALAAGYDRLLLISDDTFPLVAGSQLRTLLAEPIDRITCNKVAETTEFWGRYHGFWYFDSGVTNNRCPRIYPRLDDEYLRAMEELVELRRHEKAKIDLRHGSQFWCLRAETAHRLLEFRADERLCSSFRFSALPDELMFQSIIATNMPDLPRTNMPLYADFTRPPGPFVHGRYADFLTDHIPPDAAFIRKIAPDATALARDMADRLLRGEAVLGAAAARERAA